MDRSSQVQPMDYEYHNGSGPLDENSPFIAATKSFQQQEHNRGFGSQRGDLPLSFQQQRAIDHIKAAKRPFGDVSSSPTKSQGSSFPSLRAPASGQTFLFSDVPHTDKPLPNPNLWTPRNNKIIDFSSGGETPDTVDNNADNEATPGTPKMGFRKKLFSGLSLSGRSSPTKEIVLAKGSPGRGEIAKPYSNNIVSRIQKSRKRPEKRRRTRKDDYESEAEAGAAGSRRDRALSGNQESRNNVASFFSYLETHPQLPHLLSFYAQLLLNLFFIFSVMYIAWSFWATIRADVDDKAEEAIAGALQEMAVCAKNYNENRCEHATRVPAMETVCNAWEKCMQRDPKAVGRARVSAHTFAEIFNSFVEPISYKAMVCSVLLHYTLSLLTLQPVLHTSDRLRLPSPLQCRIWVLPQQSSTQRSVHANAHGAATNTSTPSQWWVRSVQYGIYTLRHASFTACLTTTAMGIPRLGTGAECPGQSEQTIGLQMMVWYLASLSPFSFVYNDYLERLERKPQTNDSFLCSGNRWVLSGTIALRYFVL
jgi:hypothetical protein